MGLGRLALERLTVRLGAIFPGQGSQAVGMGGALVERYDVARDLFARAARLLEYDLLAILRDGPDEKLRETRYSQPAIFVLNYALARAAGDDLPVVASAGHSFSEFCSLTLAGALDFEDALALVHERGLAMHEAANAAPGAMVAVLGLPESDVRAAVGEARAAGRVRLANFNAPTQIVISGDRAAVDRAASLTAGAGAKRVVPLNVAGAWHSELMEAARERFAPFVAGAALRLPRFPIVSNVDGEVYRDVAHIRRNLTRSVTDEVRWHDAALRLLEERLDLVVEFGGSAVLAPLWKRLPDAVPASHVGDERGVEGLRAKLAGAA